MVTFVAETAHKYKNIGQSVFKETRNVREPTKEEEASRQLMNFSKSDLIQRGCCGKQMFPRTGKMTRSCSHSGLLKILTGQKATYYQECQSAQG